MKFAHYIFLLALPLLWLGLGAAFRWSDQRRRALMERFAGPKASAWGDSAAQRRRVWRERLLWQFVFSMLLIALARPLWFHLDERSEMPGTSYIIALDASRSMLAEDVKPTRYAAATNALVQYFANAGGDRIGLITFSGVAYLNAPLTPDFVALRTILGYVNPQLLNDPGSSLTAALDRAHRCFSSNNVAQRILIIISDGEDLAGTAPEMARRLRRDTQLTVHTLGAGTAEGTSIPLLRAGRTSNGVAPQVATKLDEASLRRLATAGGGKYYRLGARGEGLAQLRAEALRPLAEKAAREDRQNYREIFYIPLALALAGLAARLIWSADRLVPRRKVGNILNEHHAEPKNA